MKITEHDIVEIKDHSLLNSLPNYREEDTVEGTVIHIYCKDGVQVACEVEIDSSLLGHHILTVNIGMLTVTWTARKIQLYNYLELGIETKEDTLWVKLEDIQDLIPQLILNNMNIKK